MAPTNLSQVGALMYRLGKANSEGVQELGNLMLLMTFTERHEELAALWKRRAEYNGLPHAFKNDVSRYILRQKNVSTEERPAKAS